MEGEGLAADAENLLNRVPFHHMLVAKRLNLCSVGRLTVCERELLKCSAYRVLHRPSGCV